jgi:hypothetical protein
MPNLIQIKRSATTATPPTLAVGELAWSEVSKTLFIGESGSVVTAAAGSGVFAKKADSFAVSGDATGTGTLVGRSGTRLGGQWRNGGQLLQRHR